jgi:hypothetical protein
MNIKPIFYHYFIKYNNIFHMKYLLLVFPLLRTINIKIVIMIDKH